MQRSLNTNNNIHYRTDPFPPPRAKYVGMGENFHIITPGQRNEGNQVRIINLPVQLTADVPLYIVSQPHVEFWKMH